MSWLEIPLGSFLWLGVALDLTIQAIKERGLFQIIVAVGNHGMGMQVAAQPGAFVKIRRLPFHRFASFFFVPPAGVLGRAKPALKNLKRIFLF